MDIIKRGTQICSKHQDRETSELLSCHKETMGMVNELGIPYSVGLKLLLPDPDLDLGDPDLDLCVSDLDPSSGYDHRIRDDIRVSMMS